MRTNALIIQQIKLRKHNEEKGIKRPLALTHKSHVSVDMYVCILVCICICKCIYRCSSAVRDTIFMNDIEHTQTHPRTHTDRPLHTHSKHVCCQRANQMYLLVAMPATLCSLTRQQKKQLKNNLKKVATVIKR